MKMHRLNFCPIPSGKHTFNGYHVNSLSSSVFLNLNETTVKGTSKEIIQGKIREDIKGNVLTFPRIHNMMVVTSPMGDHAPPLLAAIMIIPEKIHLSDGLSTNFLKIMTMIIVVVILSKTADMKKAIPAKSHSNVSFLRVVIPFVMILKPACESTSSTIVIAPMRKTRVSQVLP